MKSKKRYSIEYLNLFIKINRRLVARVGKYQYLCIIKIIKIYKNMSLSYSTDVRKGINYVRQNVDMADVERAMTIIDRQRCPLYQADPELDSQIYDLMEEYGQDNDLPECWWISEITEDDILFEL